MFQFEELAPCCGLQFVALRKSIGVAIPFFGTTVRIHSGAMARRRRERDGHWDTSDQAWLYWGRQGNDVLGVDRFGFTVSSDGKMLFPPFPRTGLSSCLMPVLQLQT